MSAGLKAVQAPSELVEIRDALAIEIVPMLDALQTFARFSAAMRNAAAVIEREPAVGQRLRAGGVDLADLLDLPPETMLANFAWAIRMRASALAEGGANHG